MFEEDLKLKIHSFEQDIADHIAYLENCLLSDNCTISQERLKSFEKYVYEDILDKFQSEFEDIIFDQD